MQPASFPLPNIRAHFESIGRHQTGTFGVMDLTAIYHQAPLYEPNRHFTAFICYAGIFHFTRLPLGLGVLPLTSKSRWPLKSFAVSYTWCEIYLNDIIVYGRGFAEFLSWLRDVFLRLREFRVLLKAKKCKYGCKSLEYVGRTIPKDGLSMSKIESILNFPRP